MAGLTVGNGAANKDATEIHVGASGGNKQVTEGWVGTAGGNKQFYALETPPPPTPLDASIFQLFGWQPTTPDNWQLEASIWPSGGSGSYTYAWSIPFGSANIVGSATDASVVVQGYNVGGGPPITLRCTVYDGVSSVAPEANFP